MRPSYITDDILREYVRRALEEDIGWGDVTTEATVSSDTHARARVIAREAGVLAGVEVAIRTFLEVHPDLEVRWEALDGQLVAPGSTLAMIEGSARAILTAERTALNFLQRMSGVATLTRRMVEAIKPYSATLLDTRKTMPGLRLLDKWAVLLGGGANHRMGLFDRVLIKENHIRAAGGVIPALEAVCRYLEERGLELPVEVEARTLREVVEILRFERVECILLDNMTTLLPDGRVDTSRLEEAVQIIGGRIPTEASGNVRLDTIHFIAATGVDYISSGAMTHSARALDLSLLLADLSDA